MGGCWGSFGTSRPKFKSEGTAASILVQVCSGVVGGPQDLTDKGEVPYFPRAQNTSRAVEEQEGSWGNFVPGSHWDQRLGCWLGAWTMGADQMLQAQLVTNFRCPLPGPLLQ